MNINRNTNVRELQWIILAITISEEGLNTLITFVPVDAHLTHPLKTVILEFSPFPVHMAILCPVCDRLLETDRDLSYLSVHIKFRAIPQLECSVYILNGF